MNKRVSIPANDASGDGAPPLMPRQCALPEQAVGELIRGLGAQCRRYRKQLRRCQKKPSEKAIHDSRVETRRLVSSIELLALLLPKGEVRKAGRILKEHLDTFDDLRDTQVQLGAIEKLQRAFPAARQFAVYLQEREERFAKQTARAIRRVKTRRLEKMIGEFAEYAAKQRKRLSLSKANAKVLESVTRAFRRAEDLRGLIDPKDTRTIHCARVAFKKFRYMVEGLRQHVAAIDKQRLRAMHAYQTIMGDIQDAEVLLRTFDKFSRKKVRQPEPVRALHDELVRCRESLIHRYLGVADQLLQFWPLLETADPSTAKSARAGSETGSVTASRSEPSGH